MSPLPSSWGAMRYEEDDTVGLVSIFLIAVLHHESISQEGNEHTRHISAALCLTIVLNALGGSQIVLQDNVIIALWAAVLIPKVCLRLLNIGLIYNACDTFYWKQIMIKVF